MQNRNPSGIGRIFYCFIFLFFLAETMAPAAFAGNEVSPVGSTIRQRLAPLEERGGSIRLFDEVIYASGVIERFYQKREYAPAWSGRGLRLRQIDALLGSIEAIADEGLTPEYYHLAGIKGLLGLLDRQQENSRAHEPGSLADLDLLLTDAYLLLACHLSGGCVNPLKIESEWHVRRGTLDVAAVLEKAIKENRLKESLLELAPRQGPYSMLRRELGRYRTIAAKGGWPEVPEGILLKKGTRHRDVSLLRRRLAVSGDWAGEKNESPWFDQELASAVVGFQERHGLKADGVVGPLTRKALNVPAAARADQILVNLERLRWLSDDLGERYIYVNIADFTLDVMEGGRSALSMKVVVGKPYWYTPVFNAQLTYLVVSPSWNIPESIVHDEILPKINKDPGYLSRQKISVLSGWGEKTAAVDPAAIEWQHLPAEGMPYRFRQEPGPLNPLGRIKFMFPNRFNVYLHDTPAKTLFGKGVRTFSHGCIRLEKPLELAEYLLRENPDSLQLDFEAAAPWGEELIVRLARPIEVYIVYLTAWSDDEGRLQFRDDIYGRDAKVLAVLRSKPADSGSGTPGREEQAFARE